MEKKEQRDAFLWFKDKYPAHVKSWRASMSDVSKRGRAGAILWNTMKSQGVQKGETDIAILIPKGSYGSLLIEHKGEGMSREVTEDQREHLDYHNSVGNCAISTRGLEALKAAIDVYMGL